jgi:hypothetical protein
MDVDDLLRKHGEAIDRLYDTVASVDVFDRQYGAELASWELNLQKNFKESGHGRWKRYNGFVHYTRDPSVVLLSPSPWMLEGVFIHFQEETSMPPEGAYIAVSGPNVIIPRLLEQSQIQIGAVSAREIELLTHNVPSFVSAPPRLRDLTRMLFENVGMAQASKRVFAELYISSPPTLESVGGLTAGIQALASKGQIKRLFRFMRDVLPPSMRSTRHQKKNVRGMLVETPKMWRMEVGPIGKSKMETLCIERKDSAGFREVSVAALTDLSTSAMPDVPLALASEDFWIENGSPAQYRLPIIKSAITYQLLSPEMSKRSMNSSVAYVEERLEIMRNSFGLGEKSLARGRILDANMLGKPLSAIRLARAEARASWKGKITQSDVKRAWDRVLEPAIKEFIEIAEIKEQAEARWGTETRLDKYNTKILGALRQLDIGKRGSPGPTLEEIALQAGVETYEAAQTLSQMKRDGIVYEPRLGHYRFV